MDEKDDGPGGGGKAPVKRQVPAVTRAAAILRLLSRSDAPQGVNAVARELGLVPSTCLHILRALEDEGLAEFEPETKRWTVGLGILALARSAMKRSGYPALAQPLLAEFSDRYGTTCIATQLTEPSAMVVAALSQSSLPFRLQVDLGSRFPALISATGRCFAAFGPRAPDALRAEFDALVWDDPPGFDAWKAQVEEARIRGYAVDAGTYINGVTVLAAPLFDGRRRMNRSVVALGISEQIQTVGTEALGAALLALRDELARRLEGEAP